MSNDWWARKLGRAPAQGNYPGPAAGPSYGPTGPPVTVQTPAGIQAQMWEERQTNGAPPVMVADDNAPGGQRLNWRAWAGGRGTREETGNCPNCGSTNFFTRKSESKVTQNGMASPAPQCFECSYNGTFQIFGGG